MKFKYYYKTSDGKEKLAANITVAWQMTSLSFEEFRWRVYSGDEVPTKDGGFIWQEEA